LPLRACSPQCTQFFTVAKTGRQAQFQRAVRFARAQCLLTAGTFAFGRPYLTLKTFGISPMTNSFKRFSLISIVVASGLAASQAVAQAPTDAQRSAIKASCRSDYMAHCSSVQPGGAAALQCLQKNMASLSSGCQSAVKAVSSSASETKSAAPAAESKPATTKPAATKSATEATAAPVAAPATPAAAPPVATAAPAAPPLVLRPLRPLEEVRIVNAACGADARALCSTVEPGGGRIARCLAANAAALSPACRSMLARFAAR
jgi:cell division septation protein DedD